MDTFQTYPAARLLSEIVCRPTRSDVNKDWTCKDKDKDKDKDFTYSYLLQVAIAIKQQKWTQSESSQ